MLYKPQPTQTLEHILLPWFVWKIAHLGYFSSNPLQIAKFMFHYYNQLFVRDVSQLLVTNIQVHIYRMSRGMQ